MTAAVEILNRWAEHVAGFAWPMLWQSSLLVVTLFAIDFLLRRKVRAAVLYALWLTVVVKLLLPPSLALPSGVGWWVRPEGPDPAVQSRATWVVTYGPVATPSLPSQYLPALSSPQLPRLARAAWGLIASTCTTLGLFVWMLIQWRRVTRDLRRATTTTDWLDEVLQETRRSTGLRRSVQVKLIDRPISPAVCGLFRPTVLLPRSLVEKLTTQQMRAILLHEMIHLRRGDVWMNCIQALLQVLYWWHPLLWLANARIRSLREEAVDDAVMLALRSEAEAYAPTLIQVAKLVLRRPITRLGLVGILESHSSLARRIKRLIDVRPPRKAGLTLASGLCVVAFGALALPMGQAPATEHESEASASAAPPTPASLAPSSSPTVSGKPSSLAAEDQTANWIALVQDAKRLFEMGKLDEAERTLKEVVEKDPTNQAAFYYMSLVRESRSQARKQGASDSEPHFIPNFLGRARLTVNSEARQAIYAKLESIRLDRVQFDNLSLGEIIRFLASEARNHDPAQQGVNFMINSGSNNPNAGEASPELGDVSAVRIKILPALVDIRLADLLDAIVKVADKPIKYSLEDYAIVFSWKRNEPAPLYTRMIKVDPGTLIQGLESVVGAYSSQAGPSRPKQELLREFLQTMGVDLKPPKSLAFNERGGSLLVRATLADLDIVESAVLVLNTPPPQVNIKTKFYAVPEELTGSVWSLLSLTNQPDWRVSSFSTVLTGPQAAVFQNAIESASEVEFINAASVTTLSGRQTQIQLVDLKTIATNINPRALSFPGVSTNAEKTEGIYLEATIPFGPAVDVVPWVSADGSHIQLTSNATLTEFMGYDESTNVVSVYVDGKQKSVPFPAPHIRVRQIGASAIVYDGQALVLGSSIDRPTEPKETTGGKKKRLLAILIPTIINPAGNRVHSPDELPPK